MDLRKFFGIILTCLLAVTLYFNFQTAVTVFHSQTNVLWRDQWWFLGELQSVYEGKNWLQVLWAPYWGHRPLLVRLLFYMDARLFAFRSGPLLGLTWTCLVGEILLLTGANRLLFNSWFSWQFGAALIVLLNLCLSPFQMENLIWALQVQYSLVFFCATLSFVSFSLSEASEYRTLLVGVSCFSALAGSLTMAHGLFIWPALAVQAYLCKRNWKLWVGLLIAFALLAGIYSLGYQMPETGMGLIGQLRKPLQALEISLMVVAGSISNRSLAWGLTAAALGVVSLGIFFIRLKRSEQPAWPSVYMAIALFAWATASLTAAGRISPKLLKLLVAGRHELLPSRYQTFGYIFWISLFTLALWFIKNTPALPRRLLAVPALAIPLFVVVADGREQAICTTAWGDAMHSVDATGVSLLLDAPDWERQQILWSDRSQLLHWVEFARAQRLANFSEENFARLHSVLTDKFQIVNADRCEGKLESSEPLADSRWKVTGWAWDRSAGTPPRDLVLVDASGRISGLARSGVPHHDVQGHSEKVVIFRAGWLGYYQSDRAPQKVFAVLKDARSACALP
jgi:hypothetical protein